jgi:hypothetical protein
MRGSRLWLPAGAGLALLAAPAAACSPPAYVRPPAFPGESDEDYNARIEAQARRDAEAARVGRETAQRQREDELWRSASRIVVAEVKGISAPRQRRGEAYQVLTLRLISAARGPGGVQRVRLKTYIGGDACIGPAGPEYPMEGRLVLFARQGALTDASVIDWSNAERSTHPETLELLARTEGAMPAR